MRERLRESSLWRPIAGKTANFSFFVKNTGSAVNRNVTFSSFKPENWEVTFKPEKIDALETGALKQVEVTVKPAAQALVGDYSVGVLVNGEKSDKTIEMRVTVKASTAWGWIGIGIIILVIAGLSCTVHLVGETINWKGRYHRSRRADEEVWNPDRRE